MTHKFTNQLIHEKSPYLLQHAHNPVNWYPWSPEAFEKAEKEDKPIFLSIGYSTCHWCHVMERESFEDIEIAELLNQSFIAIKVDREERPDIDAVYMSVCQRLTGAGGWPLTIIMTSKQIPFFATTYLPKHPRYHTPGLIEFLPHISRVFAKNRDSLLNTGENILQELQTQISSVTNTAKPSKQVLKTAYDQFTQIFDHDYGGFGNAPKFPAPHNLLFLEHYAASEHDNSARIMAEKTLLQMYRGGIFDHIGGGFSRYSTDREWLVPHFEKMLYDNALLVYTYAQAIQVIKDMVLTTPDLDISSKEELWYLVELFETVIIQTVDYILRELKDEEGGFYCGQDADSDGVEGKYYVFTPAEVTQVLGADTGTTFCRRYDITPSGNFEEKNIPNLLKTYDLFLPIHEFNSSRTDLLHYRQKRSKLHRDDKVLTSWNSLMIAALAKASSVLNRPDYLEHANHAVAFIEKNLTDTQARLLIRWRKGEASNAGQLDDYAFYTWSLLELYEASYDTQLLPKAIKTAEQMIEYFYDKAKGGFYLYASDSEQLIVRPKEFYDGAIPSGNSVAALVIWKLGQITADPKWLEYGSQQIHLLSALVKDHPTAHSFALLSIMKTLYSSSELICTTPDTKIPELLTTFQRERFFPGLSILIKTPENANLLDEIAPFTTSYPIEDKPAFFYCKDGVCHPPVYSKEDLMQLII